MQSRHLGLGLCSCLFWVISATCFCFRYLSLRIGVPSVFVVRAHIFVNYKPCLDMKAKGTGFKLHLSHAIITSLTQSTLYFYLNLELYFFQNYPFWNIKRTVFSLFKQMEALTGASMQYLGITIFSKLLVLLLKLLRVLMMAAVSLFSDY